MAEKVQRTYETVIAYHPDQTEEEVAAFGNKVQEIINSHEGLAGPVRYWGKFRLAYRIRNLTQGHYTHVVYAANRNTILELERNLKIWNEVIRYSTIKVSDKPMPEEELAKLSQEAVIPSPEDIITSEIEELAEVGAYTPSRPAPTRAATEAEPEAKGEDKTETETNESEKPEEPKGEKE